MSAGVLIFDDGQTLVGNESAPSPSFVLIETETPGVLVFDEQPPARVLITETGGSLLLVDEPAPTQEAAVELPGSLVLIDRPRETRMETLAGEQVDFLLVDQRGRPGPPGPAGPSGPEPDLPDMTIYFENGLF